MKNKIEKDIEVIRARIALILVKPEFKNKVKRDIKKIRRLERQRTAQSIFKDKEIIYQFSCLESWCKSRGKGKDYCSHCKKLNKLKKKHGVK